MDIKKLNESIKKALNESKEDDKNALANFLEIDVKDLEDKPDFYGMSQFSSKEDGETYAISSDEELIEQNVAEHMKKLYDGMSHEEFCKEVIPYLYGDMEDYMTIDFVSMAKDVIDQYGAGHELAYADADTDEVDYNGKTYYIFREDFTKKLNKVNHKKSMKEEMEYNRKIWDIFEENVAEYLNEHGVKPEGNNVMKYISKNAAEIVKAVLNKNYNYEEDDQAIFELYYNCPIHFTDKAQAIDKLLEEYLAESLKRCLTIEDKLLQISSLDKNESVIDKKSMKEDVNTVYVLIDNKVALNFEQDFYFAIDLLDADGLIKRAEELDKNFEQNAKEANLGSPLMNDVLYAIKVLRNSHYFVLIKNVH